MMTRALRSSQRRKNRPHVFWIDDYVAKGRLHAPQTEHDITVDAILNPDALQERTVVARAFLPGLDPPLGDAAVEVLPKLLVELRLGAVEDVDRSVGLEAGHHPIIGGV